jgi:hypothetical protein
VWKTEVTEPTRPIAPVSYGAPLGRAVLLIVLALGLGAGAFFLVPLWAPAAVALVLAARDLWCRPALTWGPAGLRCVVGLHRVDVAWPDVTAIRVREERHFLAFGHHLEIDLADETLLVLSGQQLGAPAADVAAALDQAVRTAW